MDGKQKLNDEQKKITEDNLGLVYSAMRGFHGVSDYEDLFGAGCVGLCKAALHWKEGKSPFSTYAYHFIRHEMINALKVTQPEEKAGLMCGDAGHEYAEETGYSDIENKILLDQMMRLAQKLPDQRQVDVVRCLGQGKTIKQTAQTLNLPLSTVYRARRNAAAALKQWVDG